MPGSRRSTRLRLRKIVAERTRMTEESGMAVVVRILMTV